MGTINTYVKMLVPLAILAAWVNSVHAGDDGHAVAIKSAGRAIAADPRNVRAYEKRADAYMASGRTNAALADYEKAIELGTKNPHVYYSRGLVMKGKQQVSEAIGDFSEAIKLDGKVAVFHLDRGLAYLNMSMPDRAIEDFTAAISLAPDEMPYAYFYRARALSSMGRNEEALRDYGLAISQYKSDPAFYTGRAEARAAATNYEGAISDAHHAVVLGVADADRWRERIVEFRKKAAAAGPQQPAGPQ